MDGPTVSLINPGKTLEAALPPRQKCRGFRAEYVMDKDHKEALQVAKELTAKFIETRTVSPGNFAEIFPAVFRIVYQSIREAEDGQDSGQKADQ